MKLSQKVRNIMRDERLMFVYRGTITNENSESLLMLLEKEMEESDFGFPGRKRLFMFVMESLQNVSRHSTSQSESDMSLVIYSRTDRGYRVTTANVIGKEDSRGLREQLDLINSMDAAGLKNLYLQKLINEGFSEKGGAGLGLIEMARKLGSRLDYDFIDIDGERFYFIISKMVEQQKEVISQDSRAAVTSDGKRVIMLGRMMARAGIAMIWSGPVTPGIGKNVLSFTETRMNETDMGLKARRRMFSIMMESIQNISRYNPGPEVAAMHGMPFVMIMSEDGGMKLTTGSLIANHQLPLLIENLNLINSYDRYGLKGFYRKLLSDMDTCTDKTGLMGLVDIARKSGHKLEYDFEEINDSWSYYLLSVFVDPASGGVQS
ncbi:MAG: SiaB family protein kinase [Bacteroidales bacterium]|nr:SiaB family protein kinase [Bacteroidales bacterium]